MGEGEFGSVEFKFTGVDAVSVKGIAGDGNAETFFVSGVDAELVSAPGDGMKGDAGESVFDAEIFPMRSPYFSVNFVVDLVGSVIDIESEGESDGSFVFVKFTVEESEVMFVRLTFLELSREVPVGFCGESENHESRGVHIETMHGGLINTAGNGIADAVRDGVDFFRATSWNGEETAGFFNDNDFFVLEDDGHFFCSVETLRMGEIKRRRKREFCNDLIYRS